MAIHVVSVAQYLQVDGGQLLHVNVHDGPCKVLIVRRIDPENVAFVHMPDVKLKSRLPLRMPVMSAHRHCLRPKASGWNAAPDLTQGSFRGGSAESAMEEYLRLQQEAVEADRATLRADREALDKRRKAIDAEISRSLQKERQEVGRVMDDLQKEREALDRERAGWAEVLEEAKKARLYQRDRVTLNVGGTPFETTRSTLMQVPATFFSVMLSDRWAATEGSASPTSSSSGTSRAPQELFHRSRSGPVSPHPQLSARDRGAGRQPPNGAACPVNGRGSLLRTAQSVGPLCVGGRSDPGRGIFQHIGARAGKQADLSGLHPTIVECSARSCGGGTPRNVLQPTWRSTTRVIFLRAGRSGYALSSRVTWSARWSTRSTTAAPGSFETGSCKVRSTATPGRPSAST